MIVAWHEVPGTAPPQKIRPVGYGMIRAGGCTGSKIARRNSNAVSLSRIEMIPECNGGVVDHFPLLLTLRTRLAVAKAVQFKGRIIGLDPSKIGKVDGVFSVGISQARFTPLSRSSNIIGHYLQEGLSS